MRADPIIRQAMREGDTAFVVDLLWARAVESTNAREDADLDASTARLRIVLLSLIAFFAAAFSIAH